MINKRLFYFYATIALFMASPQVVMALPFPPGFDVPDHDMSRALLHMLLGDIVDVAANDSSSVVNSTAIALVLASVAPIVAITGALLMSYTMLVGVMNTANEGEAFGKKWSTIWIPVRSAMAIAMILPVPSLGGMSAIQLVVVWLTLLGAGGGNIVWNKAVDSFTSQPIYIDRPNIDTALLETAFNASICTHLYSKYMSDSDAAESVPGKAGQRLKYNGHSYENIVKYDDSSWHNGTMYKTYIWQNAAAGHSCGQIKIPVGFKDNIIGAVESDPRPWTEQLGGVISTTGAWIASKVSDSRKYEQERAKIDAAKNLRKQAAENFNVVADKYIAMMDNLAARVVYDSDKLPSDAQLRQLVLDYDRELKRPISQDNGATTTAMNRQFLERSKQDGWLYAGVYFWNLVKMQESLNESTDQNVDIRTAEAVDQAVNSEIYNNHYAPYEITAAKITKQITAYGNRNSAAQDIKQQTDTTLLDGPLDFVFSKITDGILHLMTTSSANPLIALKDFGEKILAIPFFIFAVLVGSKLLGKSPAGFVIKKMGKGASKFIPGGKKAGAITAYAGGIMLMLGMALLVVGFMFAYYLPAIPFIIWIAAVLGWLVYTMEAMIAAPLWVVMHAHPEGEGPAGNHGAQGYMILLGLVLRPMLLVIGLVISLGLMYVMGWLLRDTLLVSQRFLDPDSSRGLFANLSVVFVYTALTYKIINESFKQIHNFSSSVMSWIGGQGKDLGENSAEHESKSIIVAAASTIKADASKAKPRSQKSDDEKSETGAGSLRGHHATGKNTFSQSSVAGQYEKK